MDGQTRANRQAHTHTHTRARAHMPFRCAEDSSFEEIRDQCAAAAEVLETKLEEARRAHGHDIMGSATAAGANGAAAVED